MDHGEAGSYVFTNSGSGKSEYHRKIGLENARKAMEEAVEPVSLWMHSEPRNVISDPQQSQAKTELRKAQHTAENLNKRNVELKEMVENRDAHINYLQSRLAAVDGGSDAIVAGMVTYPSDIPPPSIKKKPQYQSEQLFNDESWIDELKSESSFMPKSFDGTNRNNINGYQKTRTSNGQDIDPILYSVGKEFQNMQSRNQELEMMVEQEKYTSLLKREAHAKLDSMRRTTSFPVGTHALSTSQSILYPDNMQSRYESRRDSEPKKHLKKTMKKKNYKSESDSDTTTSSSGDRRQQHHHEVQLLTHQLKESHVQIESMQKLLIVAEQIEKELESQTTHLQDSNGVLIQIISKWLIQILELEQLPSHLTIEEYIEKFRSYPMSSKPLGIHFRQQDDYHNHPEMHSQATSPIRELSVHGHGHGHGHGHADIQRESSPCPRHSPIRDGQRNSQGSASKLHSHTDDASCSHTHTCDNNTQSHIHQQYQPQQQQHVDNQQGLCRSPSKSTPCHSPKKAASRHSEPVAIQSPRSAGHCEQSPKQQSINNSPVKTTNEKSPTRKSKSSGDDKVVSKATKGVIKPKSSGISVRFNKRNSLDDLSSVHELSGMELSIDSTEYLKNFNKEIKNKKSKKSVKADSSDVSLSEHSVDNGLRPQKLKKRTQDIENKRKLVKTVDAKVGEPLKTKKFSTSKQVTIRNPISKNCSKMIQTDTARKTLKSMSTNTEKSASKKKIEEIIARILKENNDGNSSFHTFVSTGKTAKHTKQNQNLKNDITKIMKEISEATKSK